MADAPPNLPPPWLAPLLDRLDRLVNALESGTAPVQAADQWLSAAQLADVLGVCERSIRTWELTGKLPPPVRVGRLKKWNRAEVERHLSNNAH